MFDPEADIDRPPCVMFGQWNVAHSSRGSLLR